MIPKLLKDISASTIQVLVNQFLGLSVFLLTSWYLPKEIYGELNWSVAILMFATTVLSLRLEQIVVRKSASEKDPSVIMTLFMIHVLLTGAGFYLVLLLSSYIFPAFFSTHYLLLLIGISQLLGFFSSPFKHVANGREKFDLLAIMASTANLVKAIGLVIGIFIFKISIQGVIVIFIISSGIELLVCFFLVNSVMQVKLTRHIRFSGYVKLLKDSFPQIGAAVLMAGITRMDWILLGIFSTSYLTAEYSFAYRVYELSPIPLLIIAPILLSRFSKYFVNNTEEDLVKKKEKLSILIRYEMILAVTIPLVLNVIWSPVMDAITDGKYGSVNQFTFLILSLCIPFQYITNLLWSAQFAQNRLKLIFRIALVTFLVIFIGDLVFIPLFDVKGAALVYFAAIVIEYLFYMRSSVLSKVRETWVSLLICLFAATGSGFLALYLFQTLFAQLGFSLLLFFTIILATKQVKKTDITFVFQIVRKKNS